MVQDDKLRGRGPNSAKISRLGHGVLMVDSLPSLQRGVLAISCATLATARSVKKRAVLSFDVRSLTGTQF